MWTICHFMPAWYVFCKFMDVALEKALQNLNVELLNKEMKTMMPTRKNQNWLPDVFSDFFDYDWMRRANATAPAINVIENEKSYKVEVAAPGMTKEDFDVHVDENDNLVISMEKKTENKEEQKNDHYLRREFAYSKFMQTMVLPENVDKEKISAEVKHGVLSIELPKKAEEEAAKCRKRIEIQ